MAIIRVNKTTDYTVMGNFHLKDKRLSLKGKGLLSLVLSLPDNWNYTINGLVAVCLEGENAITSALNELKKNGYLKVDKIKPTKDNGGRYEYVYNFFEQPKEIQGVEIQGVENHPLYKNTNILNTNILNTKDKEERKDKKERKKTSYDEILSAITDNNLRELYFEYIKMRKLIKSPMTDRALKMLINKVNELEPNSIDRQKRLLETAIINNWKSVYRLKDEYNNTETASKKQNKNNNGWHMPPDDEEDPLANMEW